MIHLRQWVQTQLTFESPTAAFKAGMRGCWWLRLALGTVLGVVLLLSLLLQGGCSYAPQEWLGRQLSGLDCRPEKLDAQGRCVAAR